ncbi:trehalose-phosphatase [Cryptosporangium sp. NPDC051539]|uniref:trehalose-phosphatase n=1 Tax=Cryptosporangium sp. NPDC051539 TaxID=3363962 RepID=UPI0037ADEF49
MEFGLSSPQTRTGIMGLQALLSRPRDALMAFDFDGVLAPITDDPATARPVPGILEVLGRLGEVVGSLAVITGRTAADVVSCGGLAALTRYSGLTVFGVYGLQHWDAKYQRSVAIPAIPGVAEASSELSEVLETLDLSGKVKVNHKGSSLALHLSQAESYPRLHDRLAELAARHDLVLEAGKTVLELIPPGVDKGTTLMSFALRRAASVVTYFGDDLSDVAAFRAVDQLRESGVAGIRVGVGPPDSFELHDYVDMTISGPSGVLTFLRELVNSLTRTE